MPQPQELVRRFGNSKSVSCEHVFLQAEIAGIPSCNHHLYWGVSRGAAEKLIITKCRTPNKISSTPCCIPHYEKLISRIMIAVAHHSISSSYNLNTIWSQHHIMISWYRHSTSQLFLKGCGKSLGGQHSALSVDHENVFVSPNKCARSWPRRCLRYLVCKVALFPLLP